MPKANSQLLKTLIALGVAIVVMLLVRAVVVTILCVEGEALQPTFLAGDRVMVNRWSYGLRIGGNRFLHYNRLWRCPVERGDIVALNDPTDSLEADIDDRRVLLLRCKAVPGDKVKGTALPSRLSCAEKDYYLMEPLSSSPLPLASCLLVPEDHIIGRAALIIYSHDPSQALWKGWRSHRLFAYP